MPALFWFCACPCAGTGVTRRGTAATPIAALRYLPALSAAALAGIQERLPHRVQVSRPLPASRRTAEADGSGGKFGALPLPACEETERTENAAPSSIHN